MSKVRGRQLTSLAFVAVLILTAAAYAPGLNGTFHFDDGPNLAGLSHVVDATTAMRFATEGIGGPLGRPLALASFVPQAYAWPSSPRVFLHVNVLIHLLNGVLVVWALQLLGRNQSVEHSRAAWIAVMSGAVWMLMPILASSSLLVVQRMTTLAATFSLLGLIGYLYARYRYDKRPRTSLLLMTFALVAGSLLATLAKENGALLPLYVLVAEATLLTRPSSANRTLWNTWTAVVLVAPAATLLCYLALRLDYSPSVEHMRGFSGSERLLTQAHVLWQYLYHAFIPSTSGLGPFHDDYPVHQDWFRPSSVFAVGGWLVVIVCAFSFRRRTPVLSFGVLWYLVGHSMESTVIPLELYFEHRNYMPLMGPIFALVSVAATPGLPQPLIRAGLVAYGLALAGVLFNTTSLWGRPELAAEMWFKEHPNSTRAVQYVARQLYSMGDIHGVRHVLTRYSERNPWSSSAALQALVYSCAVEPKQPHLAELRKIQFNLPSAKFEYSVFDALRQLHRIAVNGHCNSVDRATVYDLTADVASLPAFRAVGVMQHNLHVLMSEEAFLRRDLDLTMRHIEAALTAHYTITSLLHAVNMLVSAGLHSTAAEFVTAAREQKPTNPLRAARWDQQLAVIQRAIEAAMIRETSTRASLVTIDEGGDGRSSLPQALQP